MKRLFRHVLCVAGMFCCIQGYTEPMDTLHSYTLYNIGFTGSFASSGLTPFGIVGNRYGKTPLNASHGYMEASGHHRRWFAGGFRWDANVHLVASTSRYRKIYVQEAYADVSFKDRFHLSIGSREGTSDMPLSVDKVSDRHMGRPLEREAYNQSLSDPRLSSGDLALSSNARPIPEINFYVPRFLTIPLSKGWLQAKGNFAVGRSFDTGYLASSIKTSHYIKNVLWHHKSFYLQIKDTRRHFPVSWIIGVRHFAQWGGVSTNPKLGEQPRSFADFMRIVAGKSGDDNASLSDQINVLGNHYGTYDLRWGYETDKASVYAYYQHFFDDRSGIEWDNKWDGLKGLEVSLPAYPWMSKIVVEYLSTMNQSGPFHFIDFDHAKYPGYGGGADNYYNNGEYTTGASYFNRSLGSPLLISPEYNEDGSAGFKQNRIRAWHLGVEGRIVDRLYYTLKASSVVAFGTPYAPTLRRLDLFTLLADFRYFYFSSNRSDERTWKVPDWEFGLVAGWDSGSLLGNHIGVSVSIAKRGLFR